MIDATHLKAHRTVATVLPVLPGADILITERGYDSDWFRKAVIDRAIKPCIPGRKNRKRPDGDNTVRYKQRNLIGRMSARLKDRRRSARPDDRCAHTFMSAICIAATAIFWL